MNSRKKGDKIRLKARLHPTSILTSSIISTEASCFEQESVQLGVLCLLAAGCCDDEVNEGVDPNLEQGSVASKDQSQELTWSVATAR